MRGTRLGATFAIVTVDDHQTTARALFDRLKDGREVRIAGLGDSLTYGWMVRRGFFDRFCDAIEKRYVNASLVRFNEGVPGDTAKDGLARLPAVLHRRPHLMLVQFGLNDVFSGVSVSSFAVNLTRIIEGARQEEVAPWLVVSSPPALSHDAAAARPFYDAIRTLGEKCDIPVADLDRYWRQRCDPADPAGALFLDDGVHPNDDGYALVAEGLLAGWDALTAA